MLSSIDKKYPLTQKNLVPIMFVILFVMIFPMVGTQLQKHEAFGISSFSTINVSHDNGISHSEKILASRNNVYLVWLNGTATGPPETPPMTNDILFVRSTDGGTTFSIPIKISNVPNDDSLPPVIAYNGNNVYISWIQSNSGNPSLNFARSIDGGITFSSPIQINQGISGPQEEYITTNGNNVYIAFTNSASAGVFFVSSTDDGISFTVPQQMSSGSNNHDPKILVKGTNVYLAWDDQNNGVYFRKSTDSGNTFGNPINISQGIQGGGTDIAISGNYIYATWYNFGVSNQILFARSIDDGSSFGNPITLSTGLSGVYPKLATSGNNVYLTWQQEISSSPYYDIVVATSSDNGNTFNFPVDITSGTVESHSPQINATANSVYLSWQGYHSSPDVFYSSSANGLTFTSPSNISQDGTVIDQQLASSQNNVYLAWGDNSVGNGDIFVSVNPSIPVNTPLTLTPTVSPPGPVDVGTQVTLDANPTGGGPGPITYQWSITSAPSGSTSTISNPGSQNPTFTPDISGSYQFSVTANDPTNNPPVVGPMSVFLSASPSIPPSPNTVLTMSSNATTVTQGQRINFTYYEQNTGNVALTGPSVTDSSCAHPPVSHVSRFTNHNVGDANNNGILDQGETWLYQCVNIQNSTGIITHTATGTGTDPSGNIITAPAYPSEQTSLSVMVNPITTTTGAGTVTFTTNSGYFASVTNIGQSGMQVPDGTYPYGFFSWTINTLPNSCPQIELSFPNPVPAGSQWVKVIGGLVVIVPITISGNTITMTICDNQVGDENHAWGIISDPGGLILPTDGRVTGGGQIGKNIDFTFMVRSDSDAKHTTKGTIDYEDKSIKIKLHSNGISFLSVNPTVTGATFVGKGNLDKHKGDVNILASITDPDKKGERDTFSITITDNTGNILYNNSGTVKGHVEIHKFSDHDDKSDSDINHNTDKK